MFNPICKAIAPHCMRSLVERRGSPSGIARKTGKKGWLVAAWPCWIAATALLVHGSDAPETEHLIAVWESQRVEIVSATITYRYFVNAGIFAPMSPDEVRTMMKSYNLAERPDDLKSLIDRLVANPPYHKDPPGVIRRFQQTGGKIRLESPAIVDVNDGDSRIEVDRSNQVITLRAAGGSRRHLPTLNDFRIIPPEDVVARSLRFRGRDDESLIFGLVTEGEAQDMSRDSRVFFVAPATAMVVRSVEYDSSGKVHRERMQYGIRTYPGDIVFPDVIIEAKYAEAETLDSLRITIIQEATFNEVVDNETFVVNAAGNTPIFYEREGVEDVVWTKEPVSDIKAFAAGAETIPRPSQTELTFRRFALAVLGAIVVAVGVLAFRESRRRSSRTHGIDS